jgi:hypothetical protein
MRRWRLGRRLALASAFALTLGLMIPATAAQAIPAGGYWNLYNRQYGPFLGIDLQGDNGGDLVVNSDNGNSYGGTFVITSGTYQEYKDYDNGNWCLSYDNSNDTLFEYPCEGATWQEWRSEQLSNGAWLIWSEWFANAYPHYCGNYQAVITTNGGGGNNTVGAVYLACPQGGVFTTSQEWNAYNPI